MSTEHESMLAKMAQLQGTIDERKKNLDKTPSSQAPQPSNTIPSSSYYSRVNSALPVVTKTTWKLATAPNRQSSNPNWRAGRSTKLILNRPTLATTQAKPIPSKPISLPTVTTATNTTTLTSTQALSGSAPPFHPSNQPSSNPILQPVTTTRDLSPAHPFQTSSLAPDLTPSPVAQTTSNLSKMTIASNLSPAPSAPTPAAIKTSELVINGVSFVRDTQGKKLVRKTELAPPPAQSEKAPVQPAAAATTSTVQPNNTQNATPIKALISGMTYVRTKSGNLVELSALKKFQAQRIQEIKRARLVAAVNAMKIKYANNGNQPYFNGWDPKKPIAQP